MSVVNKADQEYIKACQHILEHGVEKSDRTGTGTKSVFGVQMRFNLQDGFPLLTTKAVHWHSVVTELLWFLLGDTNIGYLRDHKVRIWNAWATEDGEIGPMYGKQWREWEVEQGSEFGSSFTFWEDQIQTLIKSLKEDPDSRRHLVSAWNVSSLPDSKISPQDNVKLGNMALAPCHYSFQCYVADGKLSMLVNQRSADMFLGVPFNIASYSLLTHMIALVCDLDVGELVWSGGDCHLYLNHLDQIKEQIKRYEDGKMHPAPTLELNSNIKDIDLFMHEDIHIHNYKHEAKISAPVAV